MANKHRGSCLCGSVKYELLGEFQSFFYAIVLVAKRVQARLMAQICLLKLAP